MSEALCGKPNSQNNGPDSPSMKSIEKNMPPVHHQQSAGWCYAVSACDILNYNNHLASKTKRQAYSAKNEISVIDAVAKKNEWEDSHTDPRPVDFGKIDIKQGGDAFSFLTAMQEVKKVRSQEQLPIASFEPENRHRNQTLRNALSHFGLGPDANGCDFLQSPAKELYQLNRALAQKAANGGNLKQASTVIENYPEYAKNFGNPEIDIPAIVPHLLDTLSAELFLTQIKSVIDKKQPVLISPCANKLLDLGPGCGGHQMTVVGTAYIDTPEGPTCTVRLRNTWGANWKDGGYINIPLDKFMSSFEPRTPYRAVWAETSTNGETNSSVRTYTNGPPEDGKEKTYVGSYANGRGKNVFYTGTTTMANGKLYHYQNGKLVNDPADQSAPK